RARLAGSPPIAHGVQSTTRTAPGALPAAASPRRIAATPAPMNAGSTPTSMITPSAMRRPLARHRLAALQPPDLVDHALERLQRGRLRAHRAHRAVAQADAEHHSPR